MEESAATSRPPGKDSSDENSLEHIAAAAATGDELAFRRLVDATTATVYRVAFRLVGSRADADDVVQETYVRAWKNLGKLRDRKAVVGWLCRIARNVSTDLLRRRGRKKTRSLDREVGEGLGPLVELLASEEPDPEAHARSAELEQTVARLLGEVKEKYRTVLLLREVDGMTYDEIAEALAIPAGTVESRLHRGRKELAKKIERLLARQAREEQS